MPTLSVIILSKNVAHEIEPTLKIAKKFATEIVVVDTGSTDETLKIARRYTNKLFQTTGVDFARWRNEGAKVATGDWLLYLDSDERVTPVLAKEITSALNSDQFEAYLINRYEVLLGKHLSHWGDPWVLRLIHKKALERWVGRLHEQPKIKGKIGRLKNQLIHLSHKNIDEKVPNTLSWSNLESDLLVTANHPKMSGWRFFRIILTEFWYRAVKQRLWLDGTEGVIEIIYQMFSRFITYERLWEKQRQPSLTETYKKIDHQVLDQWQKK